MLFDKRGQVQRVEGGAHVVEPGVVGCAVDAEGCVAQAQTGMAAPFAVAARATPELDEEEGHAFLCRAEVFLRVHGTQQRVLRHPSVEEVNQPADGFLTANCFEDGPWVAGDVDVDFDFVPPPRPVSAFVRARQCRPARDLIVHE